MTMVSDGELPFTTLPSILASTVGLLVAWALAHLYVSKRGSSRLAHSLLETHHFIVATLSIGLAAYIADIGHNVLDAHTSYPADPAVIGYLYHLLKLYEYSDIILSVLSGGGNITKYAAFAHLFLPYWSYYRIVARPTNAHDWRFQAIADCTARFASRAIPWLAEDAKTENTLLRLCDEGKWYPDLAITAFWAVFYFQGQRQTPQAVDAFGPPYKEELTARLISLAVMLYAGQLGREEEPQQKKAGQQENRTLSRTEHESKSSSDKRPRKTVKNKR